MSNSSKERLEPLVYFLDECLGGEKIAQDKAIQKRNNELIALREISVRAFRRCRKGTAGLADYARADLSRVSPQSVLFLPPNDVFVSIRTSSRKTDNHAE